MFDTKLLKKVDRIPFPSRSAYSKAYIRFGIIFYQTMILKKSCMDCVNS